MVLNFDFLGSRPWLMVLNSTFLVQDHEFWSWTLIFLVQDHDLWSWTWIFLVHDHDLWSWTWIFVVQDHELWSWIAHFQVNPELMVKNYYFLVQIKDKCKDPGSLIIPIKCKNTGKSWNFLGSPEKNSKYKVKSNWEARQALTLKYDWKHFVISSGLRSWNKTKLKQKTENKRIHPRFL